MAAEKQYEEHSSFSLQFIFVQLLTDREMEE